jgi:hypothetical protein
MSGNTTNKDFRNGSDDISDNVEGGAGNEKVV